MFFKVLELQDWKTDLSFYFQFINPTASIEELKAHIEFLKNNDDMKFSRYEEVFLEIIGNEKAYPAIEKMNLLFSKYITAYFYDLLFEYDALLREPIEKFENRTSQEQNIIEYLKFIQNSKELDFSIAVPFILKLRFLDANRPEFILNKAELMASNENIYANLIMSKFSEELEEDKIKEILVLIDKLQLSNELDLKGRIYQVYIFEKIINNFLISIKRD